MEVELLLNQIRDAFPSYPLPEVTLRQGQLADQSMSRTISDQEWSTTGDKDRAVIWSAIEDQDLVSCEAALAHLDTESFTYYLPAYLTFAVLHMASEEFAYGQVINSAICSVTDLSNYNLSRLKCLTRPQIAAVIAFVQFVKELRGYYADDAEKALRLYWETPEALRPTIIHTN